MILNQDKHHVMLDIETMSTEPNAAIIAIGAVEFDDTQVLREFYVNISLESCQQARLHISASTVMWWMQQNDAARSKLTYDVVPLNNALLEFKRFVPEETQVWGNGAIFDNLILRNAYHAAGIDEPWSFWDDMCYRTVKNMYTEVPLVRSGTHHNAVDDARTQAQHLMQIINSVK